MNFIQVELYVKIHVMCPCILLLFCNDYKSYVRTNKYFEKKYHMIPEFFRHGSNRSRGIAVVEFIKLSFHRTVKVFLVRGCSRINWKIVLLPQIGSSCRPSLVWGKQNSLFVFYRSLDQSQGRILGRTWGRKPACVANNHSEPLHASPLATKCPVQILEFFHTSQSRVVARL